MINSISKKGNKFLNSKWSFAIFLTLLLIISLINIISFELGWIDISLIASDSITHNSKLAWLGILEIMISSIGSMLTISGVILTIRFDKKFIYPLVIGEILIIIDSMIIGAIFTAFSYFIMIIFAIMNYLKWKNEDDNKNKMTKTIWSVLIIFLGVYIMFGLFIQVLVLGENNYLGYFDVINSGIVSISWFILLRKNKLGFIGFLITDILYLILFIDAGLFTAGIGYLIYIFIDSISFISWMDK